MGTLLQFAPRKENRTLPPQNEMGVGSTVTQLVTKTLPIDVEKIHGADNRIGIFLSKLLQEGVVNIALDEEELDTHSSTLRVLSENDESWDLTLAELIDSMRDKPKSTSHVDLEGYLLDIFGRVGVEVLFDAYTPNITGTAVLHIEKSGLEILLDEALVCQIEGGICHYGIRTDLHPESVTAYPEDFKDPKSIPLFLLAIQYFMGTIEDRNIVYSGDSQVQLLRYHDGVMYIIETTYREVYALVMDKIYAYMPGHKSMNNDGIAMQLFYNKNVIPLLR